MCMTKFATIRMTPSMHLKVTLLRWSDWPPALSAKLLKSNLQAPSTHTARPSVRDQPPRCEAAEALNSYHQCAFCPPACALLANWMHAGLVPLLGLQRPHTLDAVRTNRVLDVTVNYLRCTGSGDGAHTRRPAPPPPPPVIPTTLLSAAYTSRCKRRRLPRAAARRRGRAHAPLCTCRAVAVTHADRLPRHLPSAAAAAAAAPPPLRASALSMTAASPARRSPRRGVVGALAIGMLDRTAAPALWLPAAPPPPPRGALAADGAVVDPERRESRLVLRRCHASAACAAAADAPESDAPRAPLA